MTRTPNPLIAGFVAYAARLRFPLLFGLTALLFFVDLIVPDLVPFVDEVLLGLAAALFGTWKKKRRERNAGDPIEAGADGGADGGADDLGR